MVYGAVGFFTGNNMAWYYIIDNNKPDRFPRTRFQILNKIPGTIIFQLIYSFIMKNTIYIIPVLAVLFIVMAVSLKEPWIIQLSMLVVLLAGIVLIAMPAKNDRHGYRILLIIFLVIVCLIMLFVLYLEASFSDFTMG